MQYTNIFMLACTLLLSACLTTGPVQSYSGSPRQDNQIAQLVVPGAVSLDSIDGEEFTSPPDSTGKYEIHLLPGRHILVFKYTVNWGDPTSSTVVTSNLAAFDAIFGPGKVYKLEYPEPQSEFEAIELRNKFIPVISHPGSGQKFQSRRITNRDAIMISVNEMRSQTELSDINVSKPVVDINKLNSEKSKSAEMKSQALPDVETAVKEDTVKRLKFWWLMSNEMEREEFRQWMKSVDESFSSPEAEKSK